jgi:lipoic acid synthetase
LPPWLKRPIAAGPKAARVRAVVDAFGLATVCCGAKCPNRAECFTNGTATFMILGDVCTRNCSFCAVTGGDPASLRSDEPQAVAEAAATLDLQHVVITSVTRDDLADGGADHFARTIRAVRDRVPSATIEVLTPDLQGLARRLDTVLSAGPDVFNHNVETVPRLYSVVRPEADYERSLSLIAHADQWRRRIGRKLATKSGLMVGLGERDNEIRAVMEDLRVAGCDILTIGQYLQPSADNLPVARFSPPGQFDAWRIEALAMGFRAVASGPLVRSSYHADNALKGLGLAATATSSEEPTSVS